MALEIALVGDYSEMHLAHRANYGMNPDQLAALVRAGLMISAWDESGDPRAAELPNHVFFVGTLFQPERAALTGRTPPLVRAFVTAAGRSLAST